MIVKERYSSRGISQSGKLDFSCIPIRKYFICTVGEAENVIKGLESDVRVGDKEDINQEPGQVHGLFTLMYCSSGNVAGKTPIS